MKESISSWWGDFTLESGETAEWRVGPLHIAVQRRAHELIVAHQEVEDANLPEWQFAYNDTDLQGREFGQISRSTRIRVWPLAPDAMPRIA